MELSSDVEVLFIHKEGSARHVGGLRRWCRTRNLSRTRAPSSAKRFLESSGSTFHQQVSQILRHQWQSRQMDDGLCREQGRIVDITQAPHEAFTEANMWMLRTAYRSCDDVKLCLKHGYQFRICEQSGRSKRQAAGDKCAILAHCHQPRTCSRSSLLHRSREIPQRRGQKGKVSLKARSPKSEWS